MRPELFIILHTAQASLPGRWPMVSKPIELARLLAAAAAED